MKVTIICVGKVKESFYRDAIAEFEKRLSRYCKLEILEVEDEPTPDNAGTALQEQIKEKEGKRILSKIREDAFLITLEIRGKKMDSPQFSALLGQAATAGRGHIQFVIGGSLGLSDEVCRRSQKAVSFSDMTFPHQLMRVILLEQIYRGFRIAQNEPYHK